MDSLRIGELAARAGVGIEAIRFYEREGLLPRPPRTPSGYRQYPQDTVDRLRFIQRAKELGFSLKEISELIALRLDGKASAAKVRTRTEARMRDIEEKIRDLGRMRDALGKLLCACSSQDTMSGCPILEALGASENAR